LAVTTTTAVAVLVALLALITQAPRTEAHVRRLLRGQLRSFVPKLAGAEDDQLVGLSVAQLTSFGEGVANRLYIASRAGPVYRLLAE